MRSCSTMMAKLLCYARGKSRPTMSFLQMHRVFLAIVISVLVQAPTVRTTFPSAKTIRDRVSTDQMTTECRVAVGGTSTLVASCCGWMLRTLWTEVWKANKILTRSIWTSSGPTKTHRIIISQITEHWIIIIWIIQPCATLVGMWWVTWSSLR